jgi:ABC-type Fe3+/spermidine/putrescine transport system ATPase subunit
MIGAARALDRVSLSVGRGELVSIVGPLGCSKSTLPKLIAGFAKPSDGVGSVRKRGPSHVFQELALLAGATPARRWPAHHSAGNVNAVVVMVLTRDTSR